MIGRVLSSGVEADVIVQALEDRGLARRLAEPNLITMSGEKASFLAGGEFPIPVQGERDQITVDYKKFGVGLAFPPTVLANGVINLRIEPEVSQLDYTNTVRTATVAVPALIVRRARTVVELRDGQSFAIAGLLQSINQETQEQLPWLGGSSDHRLAVSFGVVRAQGNRSRHHRHPAAGEALAAGAAAEDAARRHRAGERCRPVPGRAAGGAGDARAPERHGPAPGLGPHPEPPLRA